MYCISQHPIYIKKNKIKLRFSQQTTNNMHVHDFAYLFCRKWRWMNDNWSDLLFINLEFVIFLFRYLLKSHVSKINHHLFSSCGLFNLYRNSHMYHLSPTDQPSDYKLILVQYNGSNIASPTSSFIIILIQCIH